MKEIAALSGVSVATVSHVLSGKKKVSEETRCRVLQAIEDTNYKPNSIAQSLRLNKTQIIGVLVEDICGLPVPEIVDGISELLELRGYQVLLSNLRLLQKLYNHYYDLSQHIGVVNRGIRLMEDARVDGIIYVAMHDRRIDGVIPPVNIPLTYAYADSSNPDIISVTYDNTNSAYNITNHLIDLGHRRIALIAGHANSPAAKQRLHGYRAAMDEAGLQVPAEYIRWGNWEYHSGMEQMNHLLSLTIPPTAVFAMNDPMAAGCYGAINNRGLSVPNDVSIVGFDNREIASFLHPRLTTIALPNKQIGYTVAELLLKRLEDSSAELHSKVLPCSIIQRDSAIAVPRGS